MEKVLKIPLFYDGQFLKWNDKALVFKATSGASGHQTPVEQCLPDEGPIPEGTYKVYISNNGVAKDDGRGICNLEPSWGIQEIPSGTKAGVCARYWANWGNNRARMEAADEATKKHCSPIPRGGFYLHDSVKGYSHGCIEVDTKIFDYLRKYHSATKKKILFLQVKYIPGRSTNGGTKV